MTEEKQEKRMGWEKARELEVEKGSMAERAALSGENIKTLLMYSVAFIGLFAIAWWLANCPFEFTQRLPSDYVMKKGWMGTNNWSIVWYVVFMCAFFEF
ncbi:MAG: hypothetical protein QME06_11365, partial [Desulfobacterales bacterium]|nr:hypothetical protein [Desulfobacterales bacterium]